MEAKLTITLPETLRRRAKAVAALRGETVSDVIRESLEAYIAEAFEEAEDIRAVDEIEARLAAGTEATYDHADVWREIEAIEGVGAVSHPVH